MPVVAVYAALLALLFVVLSIRTIRLRRGRKIALGDGGDREMLRAMRVHANFAEYVPLALLLIWFVEAGGAPAAVVHLLGICLLVGRAAHAWGVSRRDETFAFRVFGMAATFTTLVAAGAYVLYATAAAS